MLTKIDYLSFTFPKTFSENHHESILSRLASILSDIRLFTGSFCPPRNFYSYTYNVVDGFGRDVGFIAWGGNGGTVNVNLSGVCCSRLSRVDYFIIKSYIQIYEAKITRCDVCYDFDGDFYAENTASENGYYDGVRDGYGGSRVSRKRALVSDCGSGNGSTLYIGSRGSATYTRLYEKGKQLGNSESNWLRLETEFRSVGQNISPDILTHPDAYFAAVSYRHASLLAIPLSGSLRFNSRKRSIVDSSEHILKHIRTQYGKYIYVLRGLHSDSDLLDLLQREGIPSRLKKL